jgi:nucleoside diphosphate kinase
MAKELAFVLINPYTIGKSRTGGVIGRLIQKTKLDVVAARMFGPSKELAEQYATLLRNDPEIDEVQRNLLADYVLRAYMPDPKTGRRRRVMMLLLEGEEAIRKVREATGNFRYNMESGRSIRDVYGDYIMDTDGKVMYVEPAVLIGPTAKAVKDSLTLWASFSESDGGIILDAHDVDENDDVQKTLVLIKPDNFRFPSSRPGNIIDIFSGSGLRIVGAKIHRMSVANALEFYGPVQAILREKLKGVVAKKAETALNDALEMTLPDGAKEQLGELLGPMYGDQQFYEIVKFMTGCWAPDCPEEEREAPGKQRCLALVYAGCNAVNIIRSILGPTDPSKAEPGSVRKEYGENIMVNAAHASDSTENAEREMGIVKVEEDTISQWTKEYFS